MKKLAQRRCRSNLYDQQARNRNAFAGVETLVDKGLLRKELIPGSEESKFSLLRSGEELGRYCYLFERVFEQTTQTQPMKDERGSVLRRMTSPIELIIDKREDASFVERLVERSREANLTTEQHDLPAGDYLFTTRSADDLLVLPLVIERKSWSDLADSVLGNGKSRLECVRLDRGIERSACTGSCQLCRMKRAGFSKIMFIIEGARCLGRDHENNCDNQNRCQYCRVIMERHGSTVRHEQLEGVLQELQVKHGCIIHFTRGYNETIDSLHHIKEILSRYQDGACTLGTYAQFCSNVRRRSIPTLPAIIRGKSSHLVVRDVITSMKNGMFLNYVSGQLARLANQPKSSSASPQSLRDIAVLDDDLPLSQKISSPSIRQAFGSIALEIDSDESDQEPCQDLAQEEPEGEVQVVCQQQEVTPNKKRGAETVNLASDSDNGIEVVASTTKRPRSHHDESEDDDVIVLEILPASTVSHSTATYTSRKRRRVRTSSSQDEDNAVPLLLIHGMHEYDKEYWDDVNKLWKCACSSFPKDSVETFAAFASKQISTSGILDEDNLPLIPRDTFLFWGLYVQLTMNVRLILTRSTTETQSIQQAWDGSLTPTIPVVPVSASKTMANTPARRSLELAIVVQECMICDERIMEGTGITTPCKHTFHGHCLTVFITGSRTRKCPRCNFQGIGLPKSPGISRTHTPVSQSPSGRPSRPGCFSPGGQVNSNINNKISKRDETVRNARLRRFGGGASTIPSDNKVDPSDDRFWTCENCTFAENVVAFSSCSVCDGPRDSTVVAFWECESCTLRNACVAVQCSACSAPNPFKVSTSSLPSLELDAFDRQPLGGAETPPIQTGCPSWTTESTLAGASTGKKVTCGACRLPGHNRSTATAFTCCMYNTPAERERRAKKKEEAEMKAREKREEAARFEELARSQINQTIRQDEEMRRMLEASARQNEQLRVLSEKEAARKKKAADRAEKRARRLSG